jgi:tRNA A37 threonylcarbamoyladenosine synthetase subunit TsaC/SUA5/YrdC
VGQGSTIVDCTSEPLTVLREGAIAKAQLEEALLGVESYS